MSTSEPVTPRQSTRFPTLAKYGPAAGGWLGRTLLLGFTVVCLYVLSIGPAIQMNKRGLISPETIEKVYFPLSLFSGIPGSQWLLDRYIRLWGGPDEPRQP